MQINLTISLFAKIFSSLFSGLNIAFLNKASPSLYLDFSIGNLPFSSVFVPTHFPFSNIIRELLNSFSLMIVSPVVYIASFVMAPSFSNSSSVSIDKISVFFNISINLFFFSSFALKIICLYIVRDNNNNLTSVTALMLPRRLI